MTGEQPAAATTVPNHADMRERSVADHAARVLPLAILMRAVEHVSTYALHLTTGVTVYIDAVVNLVEAADGSLWVEAHLLQHPGNGPNAHPFNCGVGDIALNTATIAAAFEIHNG